MQQFVLRSPEELLEVLDGFIDNKRFKSRNQLINIVLADWVAKQLVPDDPMPDNPYQQIYGVSSVNREEAANPIRDQKRKELLGGEWQKYKEQKVDLLDYQSAIDRTVERMEQVTRDQERRDQLKAELKGEIIAELVAKPEPLMALIKKVLDEQSTGKTKAKARK